MIWQVMHQTEHSSQVVLHLVSSFIWFINQLWYQDGRKQEALRTHEQKLFVDFIRLVNEHAQQEHNINFYADQLYITPRYMSMMVKKVSSHSAKYWIDDALVSSIQVMLKSTDKSAKQISDELKFPNTSFFSQYFKRLTGLTPGEYRTKQ